MSKKLYFYYGTMASAKTLRLLTTAYNFEENNIKIMVMKPSQDTRDGDGVIKSRVGLVRKCTMIQPDADLFLAVEHYNTQMLSHFSKLEWVLVDEAQFLSEKQVDQLAKVVDVLGISVMCYGLRTDFQSHLFPGSKRLLELADEINEVKASCKCGRKTNINARIDKNGHVITAGDQVMVGGDDLYRPLCRKCWYELINKKEKDREISVKN